MLPWSMHNTEPIAAIDAVRFVHATLASVSAVTAQATPTPAVRIAAVSDVEPRR